MPRSPEKKEDSKWIQNEQRNDCRIKNVVDLEKAYDKVWKQGLFIKMRDAGIHSNMYRWIKNFWTRNSQ